MEERTALGLASLPARLQAKIRIDEATGCWIWRPARPGDYGRTHWQGRQIAAHRLVYLLLVGPIPFGLHLDHVKERGCASRACVKAVADRLGLAHLEPVHWDENNRRSAISRRKTACSQGHPMRGDNLGLRPASGAPYCKACNKTRSRQWRADNRHERLAQRRQRYRNRSPEVRQREKERRSDPEYKRREAARMRQLRARRRQEARETG